MPGNGDDTISDLDLLSVLAAGARRGDGRQRQFVRYDNGQRLLTRQERVEHEAERADREAEARQRETEARQAAEAELARLRAELARFRNSST